MASVIHFQKYLSLIDPKKNAVLFSLYNYVKNYCHAQEPFNEELINTFFLRSLRFEHWRKHKVELHHKTIEVLNSFSQQSAHNFSRNEILRPSQMNIIELNNEPDLCDVIQLYFLENKKKLKNPNFKIKPIDQNRALVLIITENGDIQVQVFSPYVFIHQGKLRPIHPLTTLHYTSKIELHTQKIHELEVNLHHYARFVQEDHVWKGIVIRGYSHQNFSQFNCLQLMDQFDITQKIKFIESHYVDVKSDPDYRSIVALLEKSTKLVDSQVEHSLDIAKINLKKAQIALKQLFPNDKHLGLLITNLEYSILKQRNVINQKWLQNQNPNLPQDLL